MAESETRYDIMLISGSTGHVLPDQAIRSMLQTLVFRGFCLPYEEALHERWIEIYMKPGPAGHEPFQKGIYAGPDPVYHEAIVYAGEDAIVAPYGPQNRELNFMLEFRGCVFSSILGPLRKLFSDSLHIRLQAYTREFTELPPHREVAEGEERKDRKKKKKDRTAGTVGMRVDEW